MYLISEGYGEYVWCEDPAPSNDCDESKSIKYIRADLLNIEELLKVLKQKESATRWF